MLVFFYSSVAYVESIVKPSIVGSCVILLYKLRIKMSWFVCPLDLFTSVYEGFFHVLDYVVINAIARE